MLISQFFFVQKILSIGFRLSLLYSHSLLMSTLIWDQKNYSDIEFLIKSAHLRL